VLDAISHSAACLFCPRSLLLPGAAVLLVGRMAARKVAALMLYIAVWAFLPLMLDAMPSMPYESPAGEPSLHLLASLQCTEAVQVAH